MLVAHHIVDILRGAVKYPALMELPGATPEMARIVADKIAGAQKFDFGNLVLEVKETISSGIVYELPELTPDERSFWIQGLIPLPYPVCWFEFTLNRSRSGLLVEEVGTQWRCQRLDWGAQALLFDGITTAADRMKQDPDDSLVMEVVGNTPLYRQLERSGSIVAGANIATAMYMAIYMALMLNSRTTDVEKSAPPPAGLNKQRARRGRAPLQAHSIVTIVPARFQSRGDGTGTHRPPRLHWRRSHIRHYESHTPSSRWVPNAVHNGKTGWWISVIPRALVGRADLGEVSHEYRVEQPAQLEDAAE